MAFCSQCGTRLDGENIKFCSNCGARVELGQVNSSTGYGTYTAGNTNTYEAPVKKYSMKWFKFQIYFALFAGAVVNLIFGFNYLTGMIYFSQTNGTVSAEQVYRAFGGGLKLMDMVYGILMLALAGFGIYTRFRLAKYKSNGPTCLFILNGSSAVLSILYNLVVTAVVSGNAMMGSSNASSIVGSVLLVLINYKYFKKREELFCN